MTTSAPRELSELAAFLAHEFDRRKWSQRRAATELSIDKSTLNKIFTHPEQIPELRTLKKLSEGLGVALGRLVALCGFTLGDDSAEAAQALVGLSDEQVEWWLSIPPSRRAQLLEALQRLYEGGADPQ